MNNKLNMTFAAGCACLLVFSLLGSATTGTDPVDGPVTAGANETASSVIVQGPSVEAVKRLVLAAGGTVTHELSIIDAVGAELTKRQRERVLELEPAFTFMPIRLCKPARDRTKTNGLTTRPGGNGIWTPRASRPAQRWSTLISYTRRESGARA